MLKNLPSCTPLILILFLIVFFFGSGTLSAQQARQVITVNSSGGADYTTISAALAVATGGDVIQIAPGVGYDLGAGSIDISTMAAAGDITLVGVGGLPVISNGTFVEGGFTNNLSLKNLEFNAVSVGLSTTGNLYITGCTFRNHTSTAINYSGGVGNSIVLLNNTFNNITVGGYAITVSATDGSYILLDGNSGSSSSSSGALISTTGATSQSFITAKNNTWTGSSSAIGFTFDSSHSDVIIAHDNDISGVTSSGYNVNLNNFSATLRITGHNTANSSAINLGTTGTGINVNIGDPATPQIEIRDNEITSLDGINVSTGIAFGGGGVVSTITNNIITSASTGTGIYVLMQGAGSGPVHHVTVSSNTGTGSPDRGVRLSLQDNATINATVNNNNWVAGGIATYVLESVITVATVDFSPNGAANFGAYITAQNGAGDTGSDASAALGTTNFSGPTITTIGAATLPTATDDGLSVSPGNHSAAFSNFTGAAGNDNDGDAGTAVSIISTEAIGTYGGSVSFSSLATGTGTYTPGINVASQTDNIYMLVQDNTQFGLDYSLFGPNVDAIEGNGLNFLGGGSDYIDMPTPAGLPIGAAVRTVQMAFKRNSTGAGSHTLFSYGDNSVNGLFSVYVDAGDNLFFDYNGTDFNLLEQIDDTNWHHIALVYNGSVVTFFVDGRAAGNPSLTIALTTVSSNVQIGRNIDGATNYADIEVDEFAIFNAIRTQANIETDVLGGAPIGDASLVAYYNFNQGGVTLDNTEFSVVYDQQFNSDGDITSLNRTGAVSNFVTSPMPSDIVAPDFTVSTTSSITSFGFDINTNLDEFGTTYYVVVADGAGQPSSAEVLAGTGAGGSGELASGTIDNTAGANSATITGLAGSTAYDVYLVAQDVSGNSQRNADTQLDVTTTAATALAPGDITFTMINSDAPQAFAFMLLQPIVAGTQIYFTDEGFDNADSPSTLEGIISFVADQSHTAGDQIIVDPTGLTATDESNSATGVVSNPNAGFSLSQQDQIIAFQGTLDGVGAILAINNFLGAINTNVSGWVTTTSGVNDSALPSTLTNGTTATSLYDGGSAVDNAVYNFSETTGYLPNLQAYINKVANWSSRNTTPYDFNDVTAYGGNTAPTATGLVGFTGQNTLRVLEADVFGFNDPDAVDAQLASITLTSLGTINTAAELFYDVNGNLTNDAEDVAGSETFTYAQLQNDELVLLITGATGITGTFDYTVSDGGLSSSPSTTFTGTIVDNSLHFDAAGNDDYISVPYSTSMNAFDMTVEGWFYFDNISGARYLVGRSGGSAQNGDYRLTLQAGVPRFSVYGTVWTDVDATTTLAVSNWNHIVGVKEGTDLKIYVNGILENTVTGEAISASSTNALYLGAESVSPPTLTDLFLGQMDEVRLWNNARSTKDIRANAAGSSALSIVDASLIAYYTFDHGDAGNANNSPGNEENRLEDFSLNQNDGDLSYSPGFLLSGAISNWLTSTLSTHVSTLTPEINVLVDDVDYADGAGAYDFGTVATGGPFQDVTITIENVSLSPTDLTGLVPASVAVSNGTDYAIQTAPTLTTLSAGESDEFVVRFSPSTTGALNSTLNNTLVSSDSDENPYNISFTGTGSGTVSEIDVQGLAVSIPSGADFLDANTADDTDFGSLGYSDAGSISKTFDIISQTATNLDVTNIQISGSPNFTLDLAGWTFPGSNIVSTNQTFGVNYFSPSSEAIDESATVTISNNDPNEGTYTFVVKASAADHSLHFAQTAGNRTTTDFVTSPISATLAVSNNATVEGWIKTTSSEDDEVFTLEGNNGEYMRIRINQVAGFASADIFLGANENLQGSQVNVTDGQWHHVALVADGTDARFYVDGNLEASVTGAAAPIDFTSGGTTGQIVMGRNTNSNGFEYEGEIDELRVWNTSRTISQIRENAYNIGLSDASILTYYDFNLGEATGNNVGLVSLTDLTVNGLDGTLSNFASTGSTGNFLGSAVTDADVVPPAFVSGYPIASNNGPSGFEIEVQLTEPGTYYYTVNANGVVPADQLAIVNGDDSQSGQHGSVIASSANTTFSAFISGLSISTTYDVFLFAEDANGNTQVEITEIADVTTTAANNAPVISALDATAASTFVEDGSAIIIDTDVTFSDTEFDGTNYDGSFIAILRDGGSGNSDDVFGFSPFSTYTLVSDQILNGGTPIADFNTSTPGELYIDFNQGQSVTQADVNGVLQHVTYSNSNNNPPASVLVDYTPHDGVSPGTEVSITINITPTNDAPSMTVSSPVAFTEDAGVIILDGTMSFSDAELSVGGDFDGSTLTIVRNGGFNANDEFSFTGNASYDLSGGFIRDISGPPTNIATWTHVAASGTLTINFDQGAGVTNTQLNDVLRLIEYNNANNTPPAAITLDLTPNDGTGAGSAAAITVNITSANDAPSIAVTSPGAFTEGAGAVILDGTMTFNDPELIVADDFEGATLTIVRNGGFNANDEFSFTGDANYDLSGGFIRDISGGPFNVATWTHVAASGTLTIAFDQSANPTSAETNAILQLIEYNNPNSTPPANVVLDITGNDGAVSGSATQLTVNITSSNDIPVLAVSTPVAFTEDAGAIILDGTMTFTDAELGAATDFDGATLTIARNGGANANDVFTFNPAGGFTLPVNDLLRGGATPVGSFIDDGSGTLTINFNQPATNVSQAEINTILQNIEYNNTNNTPPANITLDLTPNDGTDPGVVQQIVVNITAANDVPSLTNLGPNGDSPFLEGGSAVIIDSDVAFSDPELATAPDYDGAVITIARNGGFNSEDVFGFNDGGGYSLVGGFITNGGNLATFDLTTNPGQLVIDFDQAAGVTLTDVNTILQNVTYSNSSGTPPANVTIDFTPNDGTGSGTPVSTIIDIYNNDSDIVATSTLSATLDYFNHTGATVSVANGLKVGELSIRDGGGTDTDGVGTTLDAITLQFSSTYGLIQEVQLFDQGFTTVVTGAVETALVDDADGDSDLNEAVFTGLSGLTAADNGTAIFSVVVTFNTASGINDNVDQIDFTVTSATANASGSQFNAADAGAASPALTTENTIIVNATDIEFTDFAGGNDDLVLDETNEIGIALNIPFSVTVAAVDANGNVDVDYTANVAVIAPTPDATFTGTNINGAALVSGAHTWSDLLFTTVRTGVTFTVQEDVNSYTDTPVFTFDVSDALSDITEDLAFVYPLNIDYTAYSGNITSQAAAVQIAQFIVADGGFGLGPDTDSNGTRLDANGCGGGNSSTVCPNTADGFKIQVVSGLGNIDKIALYTLDATLEIGANVEVGEYASTDNSGTGIFTFNLDDDNPNWPNNDDYTVADGSTARLGVYVTFKQGAGDITDNEEIKIEVIDAHFDTNFSALANSNGAPAATPGDAPDTNPLIAGGNLMEVIGDRLIFSANNPTSATFERGSQDLNFTVQAQDAIGNVDLDETSELLLSSTGGAIFEIDGTITTTFNLVAGEATPVVYGMSEEDATTITVADNDGTTGSQGTASTLSTPATSTVASSVNIHDTTAPFVATPATDVEPDDDALMDPITNVLTMQFNEEVAGVATKNITLLSLAPSVHVISIGADDPGVVSDADGLVTITLPESPKGSRAYSVTVDDGAFDDSPNNNPAVNGGEFTYTSDYQGTTEWNFTTPVDATPPTVSITRNAIVNGDIDVATSDNSVSFDIAFNEEITPATFDESDILVTTSSDLDIGGDQTDQTANLFGVNDIILTPDGDNINWTLTITAINAPTPLSTIGISIITASGRMEDETGNAAGGPGFTPVVSSNFIFDQTAPVHTVDILRTASSSPALTGVIDDLTATLSLSVDGNNYPVTNPGTGVWTLPAATIAPALSAGTFNVIVTATDDAGNVSLDGTSNELTVDLTKPTIVAAYLFDHDNSGDIDEVTIEFSEDVQDASVELTDWTVGAATPDAVVPFGSINGFNSEDLGMADDQFVTFDVSSSNLGTGIVPVIYTKSTNAPLDIADIAGNENDSDALIAEVDLAVPVLNFARQFDTDGDGNIDEIVIEMNEEVDENTAVIGNFALGNNFKGDGSSVTGILLSNVANNALDVSETDQYITLGVSVVGTAEVTVNYTAGALTDASGNLAATTAITTDDQATPVFVSATYYDTGGTPDGNIDEVLVEMSEPITDIVPGAEGDFSVAGATLAVAAPIDNGVDAGTIDDQYFTFDVSGAGANGTAALVLAYNPAGSADADLVDKGGNTLAALVNATVNALDAAVPLVTDVTSSAADGSYRQGDLIEIQITFTESVAVTGGQPQLTLETGAPDRDALYTSGTGTATLTLGYSVQSGDDSGDLDYVGTGSFTAGTIVDASAAANVAVRTLVTPAAAGSLGFNKDIVIDNAAPTVDAISLNTVTNGDDASKTTNDNTVSFNVDFADDVDPATISFNDFTVIVTGDITFDALDAADLVVANALTAEYTVSVTNVANDGTIKLRVSTDVQDLAGNFIATPITSVGAFNIDNTPPQVTFTNPNSDPTNSDPFNLTVNFDQSISGLLHTEFNVTNGATTGITGTDPGAGPFTLAINPTDNQTANVVVSLAANAVQDLAGNNNTLSADFNAAFDDQAPTITASTVVEGRDLTLTTQINETGTVYWGVYTDGATPTAADVAAGTGAISSGSEIHNLAANNINTDILLNADNTDFDLFLVSEDDLTPANQETTATLINVRSGGVVITAPVLTNICLEGASLVLGDIVIAEDIITDFRSSGSPRTLKLELPTGFEFNTSAAGDGVSRLAGGDISSTGLSLAYPSSNAVQVTYSVPTQNSSTPDQLTITGLEVMAVGATDYTGVTISRTGGSGDIYLASEGDARTFATLTSIPPYNAPAIETSAPVTPLNPYILETGTNEALGNTNGDAITAYVSSALTAATSPITIADDNTFDVTIYSDETLMTVVYSGTGATSYSPTLDAGGANDLGITNTSIGITNFWITVTDGLSCESEATKYSIAVIHGANSEGETVFTVDNSDGTTLALSLPAGYNGSYNGNGLTDFDDADNSGAYITGNAYTARFVPSAAGDAGSPHTIEYILESQTDGVQARYTTVFTVNTTQTVLTSGQTKTFCYLNVNNALAIENPDPTDFDPLTDNGTPDFYDIEVYRRDDLLTDVSGTVLTKPAIVSGDPTSTAGWTFNPTLLPIMSDGDTLIFRMIVQNETTLGTSTYATEQVIVYSLPVVTNFDNGDGDGTFDRFYCENDGTFNLSVDVSSDVGSASGTITTGYTLTYMGADNAIGGTGLNADVIYDLTTAGVTPHNNFDPADPNRENADPATQIGTYRISYTTPTLPSVAVGCQTTVETDIAVLAQPAIPTLSNDFTNHGGLVGPDYIVEYTEGTNVVPDPAAVTGANSASERFNWYNDVTLLSSLSLNTTTLDLDVSNAIPNTNGALTKDIYLTTDHFYDSLSLAETFLGCTSPIRKLSVQVHEVPDEVIVDVGASTAAFDYVAGNEYIYEYCVADASTVATMDPITLINFLDNDEATESYYAIYDQSLIRYDSVTSLTIADVTLDPITDFPTVDFPGWEGKGGQSLTFFVSQRDHNNNYPTDIAAEYEGAESSLQRITIEVNIIPDVPDATQFTGGGANYELCSGETLQNIVLTNDSDPRFEWFREDSGSPGTPDLVTDGADGFAVSGFNGRFAAQADLAGFSNINLDGANTPVVYNYYVRQYTGYNDFTSYSGCVSGFTEITITVYPDPPTPIFDIAGDPTSLEINVCEGDLGSVSFTMKTTAFVDATTTYNWYPSTDGTTLASPTPQFTGATATGLDLAISTATQAGGIKYFLISQENNSGACETELASMAVLRINVYDIPSAPGIVDPDEYYCEAGGAVMANQTVTGEGGAVFTWYTDDNKDLVGETVIHTGATATETNLEMDIATPGDSIFYISQNQTDAVVGLGLDGLAAFTGCTSPQLRVTVHKLTQYTAPVVADASICDGDAIPLFNATGTETGATISWYDNVPTLLHDDNLSTTFNPTTGNNDTNFNLQGAIDAFDGTYTFRVRQTTDINIDGLGFAGCESGENTFNFTIHTIPTAPDITGNKGTLNEHEYCSVDAITTLSVDNPNATLTYQWFYSNTLLTGVRLSDDDVSILAVLHPSLPAAVATDDNLDIDYFVTSTDVNGCRSDRRSGDFQTVNLQVHPLPEIEIVDASDVSLTDEFCYSENAADDPIFQANVTADVAAASGAWSINSTGSIYNDDPTNVTLNLDGSYSNTSIGRGDTDGGLAEVFQLTYTYTDGNGCTSSAVLGDGAVEQLTINPLPYLSIFDNNEGVTFSGTPRYCAGDYNLTDVTNDTRDNIMNVLGEFGSNFSGSGTFSLTGENNSQVPLVTTANSASFSLSVLGDSIELATVRSFDLIFAATGSKGCTNDVTQVIEVKARPEVTYNKISGGCENPAVAFEPLTIFEATGGVSGRNLPYSIASLNLTWEYYRTNQDGSANTDDVYPTDLDDDFVADNDWIVNTTGGLYVIDADGDVRDFGDTNISETFLIDDANAEGQTFAARVVAYTDDADQCMNDFANQQFATQQVDIEISPNPTFRWDGVSLGEPTTFYLRETRLAANKIDRVYLFWDRDVDFQDIIDYSEIANDSLAKTVNNTVAIPTIDLAGEANDVFVYETDPANPDPDQNPFTVAKQYNVTVAFRTSNDCVTTLTKAVNIVPSIDVAGDYGGTYHQTFGPTGDGTGAFDLITSGWFPENLRDDVLSIADSAESIRPYSWTYGDLNNGSGNGLISDSMYPQVEGSDGFAWHTAALDETGATNTYNYLSSEDSWIYSPAFDITGMSRPMVKFTMIYNFSAGNEGTVLQHSTDGGVTWTPLGSYETNTGISTGLDWFDFDNVQADPGQQTTKFGSLTALGWAGGTDDGKTVQWISARHSLNDIRTYLENDLGLTDEAEITSRLSNVRFRFAIAATNLDDNDNYFGFALDDFTIQDRTKNVMIEQFVSASDAEGAAEVNDPTIALKTSIDNLLPPVSVTARDEVTLAYHMDFGFEDPFNAVNPAGPSARSIYYNVDQVTSILDGQLGGTSSSAKSGDLTWGLTDLSLSSLKDPGFIIDLTPDPSATDTEVKGTVRFTAQQAYPSGTELRAYVAILEDTVIQAVGGIQGFGNVMRALLPSGSGEYVKLTEELPALDPLLFDDGSGGTTDQLTISWNLANIGDVTNLSAIVFIQNSQTKEIYQSVKIPNANDFVASKSASIITDVEDGLIMAKDFNMYPNPTDHEVFILFDHRIQEDLQWSIFDQTGRVFDQGEIHLGKEGFSLQTDKFPSGLYYMSIRGEKSEFDFKKLMVTH